MEAWLAVAHEEGLSIPKPRYGREKRAKAKAEARNSNYDPNYSFDPILQALLPMLNRIPQEVLRALDEPTRKAGWDGASA